MCKILVIIGHEINKTVQLLGAPPPDPHFFGGLRPPHPSPGALPLDPAGGKLPDPRLPPQPLQAGDATAHLLTYLYSPSLRFVRGNLWYIFSVFGMLISWPSDLVTYMYVRVSCRVCWNACGCTDLAPRACSGTLLASRLVTSGETHLMQETPASTSTGHLFMSPLVFSRYSLYRTIWKPAPKTLARSNFRKRTLYTALNQTERMYHYHCLSYYETVFERKGTSAYSLKLIDTYLIAFPPQTSEVKK